MKDEEKTEAEEAGSGRQLSIGGPVQVRRRRANKARRGQARQGRERRESRINKQFQVQGLRDDARLADRHNPGFQPASSLVVALGAFPTSANHRPWQPLKAAGVSATGTQYSRASSPQGIER
jgi:hypothetical protein